MTRVTVAPASFSLVHFDPARLVALAEEVASAVGLPDDVEIHVEVDETSPFGLVRASVAGRRVGLLADGGAFEDPKHLRELSEAGTRLVLGRVLFRAADRLDPAFGDPPPDGDLSLAQHAAWDAYAVGRYARLARIDGGVARRRYAFRLRHGFSDTADRAFDRLWHGQGLTWTDLLEIVGADRLEQA